MIASGIFLALGCWLLFGIQLPASPYGEANWEAIVCLIVGGICVIISIFCIVRVFT